MSDRESLQRSPCSADPNHNRTLTPKQTITTFARANPDLLHTLPVRELNIFVKKFKAFPRKSMDRKYRAATSRLTNLYADFEMEATFNGQPTFQVSYL